jgi:hypothetical protein
VPPHTQRAIPGPHPDQGSCTPQTADGLTERRRSYQLLASDLSGKLYAHAQDRWIVRPADACRWLLLLSPLLSVAVGEMYARS